MVVGRRVGERDAAYPKGGEGVEIRYLAPIAKKVGSNQDQEGDLQDMSR
jgi:hypothetical protein